MQSSTRPPRPALRLIEGELGAAGPWGWFCGRCAVPLPANQVPPPTSRVCRSCGLGLLLEAPSDSVPAASDAFLVLDSALLVQAVSRRAEKLLEVAEERAVDRPVGELLVSADAEGHGPGRFAGGVADAVARGHPPLNVFVRPSNTFGVRIRARIAPCGPPRSALLVLAPELRGLRTVPS